MLGQVWRLTNDSITWQKVADAVVVFDLRTSTYVSIDGTGAMLWEALARGADIDQLVHLVTEQFDVTAEIAHADINIFLTDLKTRRLATHSRAVARHL
jgi:Coenzyme PQQ synthesis protein D (PqqD)